MELPHDHVRLQQAVLRDAGHLLQPALPPAGRGPAHQPGLPCRALPGAGQRVHAAQRRHQRLWPRDDSRRRQGRAVCIVLSARMCESPLWPCPTRSRHWSTWQPRPTRRLSRPVYNVTSFSLSAEEFRDHVLRHFPDAQIDFAPDLKRQRIVDTWPADLDDSAARRDWGWAPDYDSRPSLCGLPRPQHPPPLPEPLTLGTQSGARQIGALACDPIQGRSEQRQLLRLRRRCVHLGRQPTVQQIPQALEVGLHHTA